MASGEETAVEIRQNGRVYPEKVLANFSNAFGGMPSGSGIDTFCDPSCPGAIDTGVERRFFNPARLVLGDTVEVCAHSIQQ